MSKLEELTYQASSEIPKQEWLEISEKEKAVLRKARRIFAKNATLASELLGPEDLNLTPEKISELNGELGWINKETKNILDGLEIGEADGYGIQNAA